MNNYGKILSENIIALRKEKGFTQEALATKIGISFQAISKWENGLSSPDILFLPQLADIFEVHIDELFGRKISEEQKLDCEQDLPWIDDDAIRGVVYKGRKRLREYDDISKFTFKLDGIALKVVSYCNIECGEIQNGATAACDVNCNSIGGGANAGCDINCGSAISGGANAGCNINVNTSISGGANSGSDITCNKISGGASAGNCLMVSESITGNVKCDGNLSCHTINGDVSCNGDISYV